MTRLEAIDKLCESYSVYFDVERFEENEDLLAATCFLYVHSEKYVLVKAAKLWEADSNEYVYIFNVPHLTKDIFTKCRDYAHKDGMSRIEPEPGHSVIPPTPTPCVRSKGRGYTKASVCLTTAGWISTPALLSFRRERLPQTAVEEVQHSF